MPDTGLAGCLKDPESPSCIRFVAPQGILDAARDAWDRGKMNDRVNFLTADSSLPLSRMEPWIKRASTPRRLVSTPVLSRQSRLRRGRLGLTA